MRDRVNRLMALTIQACALSSVLVLIGIFLMLLINGAMLFKEVSVFDFLTGMTWNPGAFDGPAYGALSLIWSTILVTIGAMLMAIPLGIAMAAFMSEVAPRFWRNLLKPLIELLAGIPSVVLGFIGIELIGPLLQKYLGLSTGFNALNGSILLCLMALPTIISLSEEAIRAVPFSFKEASYGLGAGKWETLIKVTLPACTSGLIASSMLGLGRALGETMTVLMVTGNALQFPNGFYDSVRTLTSTIAIELGEVASGTTHYFALFAVASLLFSLCLVINIAAEAIAARFRYRQT
jgi:phosphate transport system permease protein